MQKSHHLSLKLLHFKFKNFYKFLLKKSKLKKYVVQKISLKNKEKDCFDEEEEYQEKYLFNLLKIFIINKIQFIFNYFLLLIINSIHKYILLLLLITNEFKLKGL